VPGEQISSRYPPLILPAQFTARLPAQERRSKLFKRLRRIAVSVDSNVLTEIGSSIFVEHILLFWAERVFPQVQVTLRPFQLLQKLLCCSSSDEKATTPHLFTTPFHFQYQSVDEWTAGHAPVSASRRRVLGIDLPEPSSQPKGLYHRSAFRL
jgi:hypothetical protein